MKRFYLIFLLLSIAFIVLLHYSPWWSLGAVGAAMLIIAYNFYLTRLQGAESRSNVLQTEVEELHIQLDSSISREEKANKEAEKAKDIKRHLLAKINHEIRTPMNGMLGMATLLVQTPLNNDQREYTDTIRFCGENLLSTVNDILITDILNFSKWDGQGEELEKRDFELGNCVKEVLMMFVGRIDKDGPDLAYYIDEQVPDQVNGDRKRLSQVLMNLIENAVRYTRKGEILIRIRHGAGEAQIPGTDNRIGVSFEVSDSGTGITEDKLPQLFKGISSQGTADEANDGAGLGLVICKRLVELMGGSIHVESKPGIRTVFGFHIFFTPALKPKYSPLRTGSPDAGKKIILNGRTSAENGRHMLSEDFSKKFPLRILVAEDNAINQKLAMKVLAKLGYEPGLAQNGKEVLEMADLEQYDLILMDVQMPVMDGLEATRMLRLCLTKQPVIIAMTANVMQGDQDDCIQAGMDDYICKPVEMNDLLGRLEKWGAAINAKRSATL